MVQAPWPCWPLWTQIPSRRNEAKKDKTVSQTISPVEPPVAPLPEPAAQAAKTQARRGGGLAIVALLVALLGAGVAAWGVWQQQQLALSATVQAQQEALRLQLSELGSAHQRLQEQMTSFAPVAELAAQQRLLAQLQGEQQTLNQRVSAVLGASRQGWRLAEAEHLLRLASLRLVALQDINSALVLVQGANSILREQDDPDAFASREQIANLLQALRSVEQPDRSGLYLQLAALREQVATLQPLTPVFASQAPQFDSSAADGDGSSTFARWREQLSRYFRIQFHADGVGAGRRDPQVDFSAG